MVMQLIRSVACTCLGAALGLLIYFRTGETYGLVVAGLGGFIGFGLSLPGVSVSRVLAGAAGAVVAHNLRAPLEGKAVDAFLGEDKQFSAAAARKDYRKLPRLDVIAVTDEAATQLRGMRPQDRIGAPTRIVARIDDEHPSFLEYEMYYDQQWNPGRDGYCPANGIDFVIDGLSARRLQGTTLEWQVLGSEEGFYFSNPSWPRTDLTREPWEADEPKKRPGQWPATMSAGAFAALALLVVLLIKLPLFLMKERPPNGQREAARQQAIQTESDLWNERIRRGDDVPDSILLLAGIDPQEYRAYQRQLREPEVTQEATQADTVTGQAPVGENAGTDQP